MSNKENIKEEYARVEQAECKGKIREDIHHNRKTSLFLQNDPLKSNAFMIDKKEIKDGRRSEIAKASFLSNPEAIDDGWKTTKAAQEINKEPCFEESKIPKEEENNLEDKREYNVVKEIPKIVESKVEKIKVIPKKTQSEDNLPVVTPTFYKTPHRIESSWEKDKLFCCEESEQEWVMPNVRHSKRNHGHNHYPRQKIEDYILERIEENELRNYKFDEYYRKFSKLRKKYDMHLYSLQDTQAKMIRYVEKMKNFNKKGSHEYRNERYREMKMESEELKTEIFRLKQDFEKIKKSTDI